MPKTIIAKKQNKKQQIFLQPQFTHPTHTHTQQILPPPCPVGAVSNCAGLRQEITESPKPAGCCLGVSAYKSLWSEFW